MRFNVGGLLILYPVLAIAGWFGPSTYEECVIDGMKTAKSAAAANAVTSACYTKFANSDSIDYASDYPFSKLSAYRPALEVLVNNVNLTHYSRAETGKSYYEQPGGGIVYGSKSYLGVEVINRNNFSIDGLEIGIPKYSTCSSYQSDYSEIYKCSGTANPLSSGSFECNVPRIESRNITSLCITGFIYKANSAGIASFMKKYKIPAVKN